MAREDFIGKTIGQVSRTLGWWWTCTEERFTTYGKQMTLVHKGKDIHLKLNKENIVTECYGTIFDV